MSGKILVVEDTKALNLLFTKMIEKNGIAVESCFDGIEALSKIIADDEIKIILLDIMMPNLDGLAFLEKAKDILIEKEIKVCMLSALSETSKIEECLNAGALDYIIKVSDEELIINKIKFLLGEGPKFLFSKVKCDFKEKMLCNNRVEEVKITEIYEDHIIFSTKANLELDQTIIFGLGRVMSLVSTQSHLKLRVFSINEDSKEVVIKAVFIGLTESQIKSLRSQTVKGVDITENSEISA